MKTTLGVAIAAAAMVWGAGLASATVNSDVLTLRSISAQSAPAQHAYYRYRRWHRWHHVRHRHCWWRHGYRHCGWW